MSTVMPVRPRTVFRSGSSYAIVASQYNEKYVSAMADHAVAEIRAIDPKASISRYSSPGSFEIPLMAQAVAKKKQHQAIIALGIIFRGATGHADLIAFSVTEALMKISLEFETPIIHEVLLLSSEEQAEERCLKPDLNRGIEAARAAVQATASLREISN